jgi:uncharacterized RDD family membrane protein YckC
MSTDAADARYETDLPGLVIISGNDSGRRIPVPSTGIVLGREGKLASLFRDDPLVSRGHAHIYLAEDHSVQVADLNSTNGTFVNGKAIRSLTRLTDRDVLRIGSIGMRLDSPRADNRPADETVRLPAAHFSWSDTLAGRRAPPGTPRYENGRRDFPSTGARPDAPAKAHAGLGEPAPASAAVYPPPGVRANWPDPLAERLARPEELRCEDAGVEFPSAGVRPDAQQKAHDHVTEPHPAPAAAPPGAPVSALADTTEAVSFAPHPLRLLAFMIDLFLLAVATGAAAAVTGSLVVYAVVLLMAWVIYQTGSVWLTGGRTIGKAACSLSVRHIDGSAPRQDRAGLAWAFGRASLGYLVIDIGGLGILVGLRSPRRRCLHDYAFASEVVLHPDTGDPLHPRGRLERLRQRLQQFTEDRENAWEAKKKNYAFVATLWEWLVRITEISLAGLLFARDRWHALVQHLAAHAHPTTSAPAAKALTAGKITTLVATTTVATGTAVAVAAATYLAAPIIGDWGGVRITRVGVQSYHATATADLVSPRSGCILPKGQEDARISGHGQHYTGYALGAWGHDGQDCRYKWEPSTFDLVGTNILRIGATDPALRHNPDWCVTAHRVQGR